MNKSRQKTKAQAMTEVLFILMEIIMVIAAGFIVIGKVNSIDDSQIFLKKFFARDLAITINAIQVLQGNVLYFYRPSTDTMANIDFKFSQSLVEANDEKYPVAIKNFDATSINKPQLLKFIKQNKKFFVDADQSTAVKFNPYKLACPEVKTALGNVVVDAGHGFNADAKDFVGDVGFEGTQGKESVLMAALASNLLTNLKLTGISAGYTRNPLTSPEDAKTIDARKALAKDSNTIISLHLNNDVENINNLKAYVNFDSEKYVESAKLACFVLNELSDAFAEKITGAAIIPVSLNHFDGDDAKQLLDGKKVAVYFELGNINSNRLQIKNIDGAKISAALVNYQK